MQVYLFVMVPKFKVTSLDVYEADLLNHLGTFGGELIVGKMKDGRYAFYKGNTFKASTDGTTKEIILFSQDKTLSGFKPSKLNGYYQLNVDRSLVDEYYELKTYAVLNDYKVDILARNGTSLILSTCDLSLAEKYSFDRVDSVEYRKEVKDCSVEQVKRNLK